MRVRRIQEVEVPGLGERIRAARFVTGRSLEGLCEAVGLSRTYWYDLERETLKGTLSIENLRKIEAVLGVQFGIEFEADERAVPGMRSEPE